MIFNNKIEQYLKHHFGPVASGIKGLMSGGSPKPPIQPPTAPNPTGAAKQITDPYPQRFYQGLDSTILTGPQNLMQTEMNQKKTLLGE